MSDYTDKIDKTHIALIHETLGQSIARDLSTAATFIGLWSLGYYAGSAALEWVGVVIAGFILLSRAVLILKGTVDKRMTPEQAREWLDKHFPPTT